MDVHGFLRDITAARDYRGQLAHVHVMEARPARYAEPRWAIPEVLRSILRRQNIHRLYTHQAAAVDAIADGRDVVVVTGTASGKTLCYNLPVAAALLEDDSVRAIYLYPTKALAQDQLGVLQRWSLQAEFKEVLRPAVYDGDTPSHLRSRLRASANILLTNPDMLHVGILPYHASWSAFLRGLRFIVVDELHTYRGIFGSHVAGVLRRLLRLAAHYGGAPRIVCSSATIANPAELAGRLSGREHTLIDDDGSPRGRRHFVLWNPPFIGEDNLFRRSASMEAVELLAELVRRKVQTIVFGKARVVVELVYKYACEALKKDGDLAGRIRPYRGGYLPQERREIERELFSGRLLAVAATNALELGIDVGGMDAAVLVGFPGTICSTWQQAGRAGRGSQDSLVVLVGYDDPIDQYLIRHPEYLFGAPHERGVIDPGNPHILSAQLSCACFEKPLSEEDQAYFGPQAADLCRLLEEEGRFQAIDRRDYWSSPEMPHRRVNLRTIGQDTYAIVEGTGAAKAIGQVDSISAPELVYPGAVYLHEGRSYLVRRLDDQAKIAHVEPADVDYYTQPVLASSCRLRGQQESRQFAGGQLAVGPADVTWQTTAFKKIRYYTMEMIGQGQVLLPAQTLSTVGVWWAPGPERRMALERAGHKPIEAMVGVRNLMLAALPALAMCDRRDISGLVDSANLGEPMMLVYDRYPGGVGFAAQGYERFREWLELCLEIVRGCPCRGGCPSCVGLANLRPPLHQDPDLSGGYPVPDKSAAVALLEMGLEEEKGVGSRE